MKKQLPPNLALDYAILFKLEPQREGESGAQFRERIARTLQENGQTVYAHEALLNTRMSDDPFSHGDLDRGYGDEFITKMATMTEEAYQHAIQPGLGEKLNSLLSKIRGGGHESKG
jgi:hypothetical protein